MKTVEIRKSIPEDVLPIAVNMRDADAKEVWDSHLSTPYKALSRCVNGKDNVWTIVVNDVPIGIVGVVSRSLLMRSGTPFLLGTDMLVEDAKLFLRTSKSVLKDISRGYQYLENYVSTENRCSVRYLKAMGFSFGEEIMSVTGQTFKRFYMEINNV